MDKVDNHSYIALEIIHKKMCGCVDRHKQAGCLYS